MEPGALVQVYSAKRGDNLLCGSQLCLTINSVWSGYSPLRVEGYGLMPQRTREFQRRVVYSDDVIAGTVLRTERYVTEWDRMFVISLRGTF